MGDVDKWLVVIGSSAGGIEALSRLLGSLDKNFRAPIVVAQHLDPRVESSLAEILAKCTTLSVISVTNREALQPGTVYVVPANRHVEIEDDHVAVSPDGSPRPKPSVDLLFVTAARAYGDRLIAVVLTGMGSDGSAGVRAVKSGGGTVVIEDPATATFPSMPASLSPALVDIVAPIDRIGSELKSLVSENSEVFEDAGLLTALLERINATSGIDFTHYKMSTIKRRLARQIKSAGKNSLAEYRDYLERTPGEDDRLVGAFLINVTEFFRNPALFEWLQTNAITDLVKEARSTGKELRLWSAGCATGEEAYSLAILVAEVLGEEFSDFNVRIFATDIDKAAISFARHGVYPADALANLPSDIISRYFTTFEGSYEVCKKIRDITVFGQHDLGQRAPFPHIDLVLCRNVLIYFSKELQRRALQLFAFSLRNGGILVLGKAEPSDPLPSNFKAIEPNLRIFRRFGDRVPIPSTPPAPLPQRSTHDERTRRRSAVYDAARDTRRIENEEVGSFLMASTVGFVSLGERYDIAIINAAARRMLRIHGTAIGEDLVHLVPADSASRLRSVIDDARRSEPQGGGEEMIVVGEDEQEARCLSVSCYPKFAKAGGAAEVALLIVDVTELVRARRIVEARAKQQTDEIELMRERESQWRQRRHDLLEANRQLVEANAELRGRSDALMIGAEETMAATEEIETLNEEMQATNEELETLNEESQATIEELNTTNDELEARTVELQDLLVVRETQRQDALEARSAFQAIVDALSQPTAVVASSGDIVAANEEFRKLQQASGEGSVQGDDDSDAVIAFAALLRRAAAGEAFHFSYAAAEANKARSLYRGTVSPLGGKPASGALMMLERTE